MTVNSLMSVPTNGRAWAGLVLSGMVVLFLAFDGVTKLMQVAPVVDACDKLGLPRNTIVGIGVLLLVCTAVYVYPSTSVVGAILLTAYLGGAVAIHVRGQSGVGPIAFSTLFGVLVWVGLILREPRILSSLFTTYAG